MTLEYIVEIDWNDDGDFSDADEDVTVDIRESFTVERGRDQRRSLSPPMAGSAEAVLYNTDRKYSRDNSGSSIFGNIRPGRRVRFRATENGNTHGLWRGVTNDFPQHPAPENKAVGVEAVGELSTLIGTQISTTLFESIRTDEALTEILDAVGWPAGDRSLDTGQTTLNWWWLNRADAFEAITEVLESEGLPAAIYEDGDGNFVFESRHFRATTSRSKNSQATLSDKDTEPTFIRPFDFELGFDNIVNAAQIEQVDRTEKSRTVVWSRDQDLTVPANATVDVVATADDPFKSAVTPVESTDFDVSGGSLNSVSLSRASGQNTTISFENTSADTLTISNIQLRANPVSVDTTRNISNTTSASTSVSEFGERGHTIEARREIDVDLARDLTNFIVNRNKNPRAQIFVTIDDANQSRIDQLFREVSDRITVVESHTGLNAEFLIEQITHVVSRFGHVHRTTYGCEEDTGIDVAVWDTARWDEGIWGF